MSKGNLAMSILGITPPSKAITVLVVGSLLYSAGSVQASAKHRSGLTSEVAVVHPDELPPAAREPSQAMYLRAVGFSRYLYLEQENGKRLVVLDVSRPAAVKTVAVIELQAMEFEFLPALNSEFVLIRFTGSTPSLRLGVLDLKHPKEPVLRDLETSGMPSSPPSLSCGLNLSPGPDAGIPDGRQEIITDEKLGSHFVLTAHGLWIIRQLAVEKHFELEEWQSYAG